ncbi:MerR family transcriptional regulator [Streptacidiphilus pinicola]|uniref:MerR family transcriptional regulator n=1 Tax=Streptacidiphilus pinicola TaxID=2219663 RepID=A0A2X0J4M1_9ACTN|nr:MerR family transcriptional regulator [Streptacidiphilus pinicola]RAG82308.1 MerR family transcriptional regulator [Streptacidiphilus pinicola]
MTSQLSIGDFSRATHFTVKTLRHYHDIGVLAPAEVDPQTGYRRYGVDQIPTAQVVRRFRDLGMPLEEVKAVLAASDADDRNRHIGAHLSRLEEELGRTQLAVSSLRDLLTGPPADVPAVQLRSVPAVRAAAVSATVDSQDCRAWSEGALGELYATLAGQGLRETGPACGLFDDDMFTRHRGVATVFVPCDGPVRPIGRVGPSVLPAAELAVIGHHGRPIEADRSYGALAGYVARHALAVDGPVREVYLVGRRETPDETRWHTEICWPVFRPSGSAG